MRRMSSSHVSKTHESSDSGRAIADGEGSKANEAATYAAPVPSG